MDKARASGSERRARLHDLGADWWQERRDGFGCCTCTDAASEPEPVSAADAVTPAVAVSAPLPESVTEMAESTNTQFVLPPEFV